MRPVLMPWICLVCLLTWAACGTTPPLEEGSDHSGMETTTGISPPEETGDGDSPPFPTPGFDQLSENGGWELVQYAAVLCLAEDVLLSGEDGATDILEREDVDPPENLRGFHDGLVDELKSLRGLPPGDAQRIAREAFGRAEQHPVLTEVMSFPCEVHYDTMGQAMREVGDAMEYGFVICEAWDVLLSNREGGVAEAIRRLYEAEWPEDRQGIRDGLAANLEALPEDPTREMMEAGFEQVREWPAVMLVMPCLSEIGFWPKEEQLGEGWED